MDDFGVSKPPIFWKHPSHVPLLWFKLTPGFHPQVDAMEFVEQPELGISNKNLGCTKSLQLLVEPPNQKMRRSNWTCSPNRSQNKTIWNHHLVFIWMNKHILSDQARSVIFGASKSLGCWNTSPCRIQVPGFLKPRQLGKSNAGWVCLFCLFCWWMFV